MHKLNAFLFAVFLLLLCAVSHSAQAAVWIALSEGSKDYAESAEALKQQLIQQGELEADIVIKPWVELTQGVAANVKVVVAVGSAAYSGLMDASANGKLARLPVLAMLLPRSAYETGRKKSAVASSGIFLDQPITRQMSLLRNAFPNMRRVGVLVGPDSRQQTLGLEKIATEFGIQLNIYRVDDGNVLYSVLQRLLDENEILLAVPDPVVFNGTSIQNILLAAYRQKVPLVGFSPAYVRAGAVLALYSTPQQIGIQMSKLVRTAQTPQALPAPQTPQDFSIGINLNVARSLGYRLNEEALKMQLRSREESP